MLIISFIFVILVYLSVYISELYLRHFCTSILPEQNEYIGNINKIIPCLKKTSYLYLLDEIVGKCLNIFYFHRSLNIFMVLVLENYSTN